mmetsp:Transcript_7682/g.25457  ORF Transcript_7682/g.25457 Transcript_7682/m.25457 type:complete len:224 (+) Transcript_7682:305-976(+)
MRESCRLLRLISSFRTSPAHASPCESARLRSRPSTSSASSDTRAKTTREGSQPCLRACSTPRMANTTRGRWRRMRSCGTASIIHSSRSLYVQKTDNFNSNRPYNNNFTNICRDADTIVSHFFSADAYGSGSKPKSPYLVTAAAMVFSLQYLCPGYGKPRMVRCSTEQLAMSFSSVCGAEYMLFAHPWFHWQTQSALARLYVQFMTNRERFGRSGVPRCHTSWR